MDGQFRLEGSLRNKIRFKRIQTFFWSFLSFNCFDLFIFNDTQSMAKLDWFKGKNKRKKKSVFTDILLRAKLFFNVSPNP